MKIGTDGYKIPKKTLDQGSKIFTTIWQLVWVRDEGGCSVSGCLTSSNFGSKLRTRTRRASDAELKMAIKRLARILMKSREDGSSLPTRDDPSIDDSRPIDSQGNRSSLQYKSLLKSFSEVIFWTFYLLQFALIRRLIYSPRGNGSFVRKGK